MSILMCKFFLCHEKVSITACVAVKKEFARLTGRYPGSVIPLYLGDPTNPDDLLTVEGKDKLSIDLKASSDADSGDSFSIFTAQVMSYE